MPERLGERPWKLGIGPTPRPAHERNATLTRIQTQVVECLGVESTASSWAPVGNAASSSR
jgi:hypothetical protein